MAAKPKEIPSSLTRTSKVSGLRLRPAELGKFKDVLEDGELANLLNALFHGSRELVFFSDCTGRFIHANNRTIEILGYSIDELRAMDFQGLLPIERYLSFMKEMEALIKHGDQQEPRRFIIRSKSKERILIQARASLLVREDIPEAILWHGQFLQNLSVPDNGHEREKRLEAVAEISSRAAHDLKNLLTCPTAVLELLKGVRIENPGDLDLIRKSVDGAIASIQKAIQLTSDLMLLARPRDARFQSIRANSFVANSVAMVHTVKPDSVEMEVDLDRSNCFLNCDPPALERGLTNILRNALEAMPDGGKLSITTRRQADSLEIRISDTGAGIPQSDIPTIFDPYFTTKENGTGLGLAIAKKAVNDCDGTISVESSIGMGTTFIMALPVTEAQLINGAKL